MEHSPVKKVNRLIFERNKTALKLMKQQLQLLQIQHNPKIQHQMETTNQLFQLKRRSKNPRKNQKNSQKKSQKGKTNLNQIQHNLQIILKLMKILEPSKIKQELLKQSNLKNVNKDILLIMVNV